MPAKNSVKIYLENGYYHIYNRGVEKRDIFQDYQDYSVFASYLKNYLLPKDSKKLQTIISSPEYGYKEKQKAFKEISLKNFAGEIELLAYALMPNHYHLLLKQTAADGIDRFMNSLSTRYSIYFNKKYHRVGTLCQGVYKAVSVNKDEQLLHLSRYIHLNPIGADQPSSLPEYLGKRETDWIKTDYVLNYFRSKDPQADYKEFIESKQQIPEFVVTAAIDFE